MQTPRRGGFSLVEVLVVLLIFAILVSVAVPTLVSMQPQRNLAAAGERFAGDISYCRSRASATGNNVYLGFLYPHDATQVENGLDSSGVQIGGNVAAPGGLGERFYPPVNPGASRVAKEYYIVEERPRSYINGTPLDFSDDRPLTYLDYLVQWDAWDGGDPANNNPPHPIEPQFPYDATRTLTLPDPQRGGFNRLAAPLAAYPLDMLAGSGTTFDDRFVGEQNVSDWSLPTSQQYKIFCAADDEEIVGDGGAYPGYDVDGDRVYTPGLDNPRLLDTVYDYVLLKRVKLPEHVTFLNPWRGQWVVGNEGGGTPYTIGTFQFMQFLIGFSGDGEVSLNQWGYDPAFFPLGSNSNNNRLVHGSIVPVSTIPEPRTIFMVTDECVYGANGFAGDVREVRKATQSDNGRMFMLWPLNGKYYVDDFAPKGGADLDPNSADLDLTRAVVTGYERTDGSDTSRQTKAVAREWGYMQRFLDNPNLAPSPID